MLIGLARTSTLEQVAGLEAQIRDLEEYGCERVFKEQVSSVAEREQLEAALVMLRSDDKLVVTKLDRLARSVQHLGQIIERINSAGASLVILDMGHNLSTIHRNVRVTRVNDLIRVVTLHTTVMTSGSLTHLVGCGVASRDSYQVCYL